MNPGILSGRSRGPAALASVLLLAALLAWITASSVAELIARRGTIAEASKILTRLEARRTAPGVDAQSVSPRPEGAPLLAGPTLTTAGAALMQRVAAAVDTAGGRITSSQVDLGEVEERADMVGVTANVEIVQASLPGLLYDLEAGMPFLFVDQLDIQAPETRENSGETPLRVQLTVSGRWEGAR